MKTGFGEGKHPICYSNEYNKDIFLEMELIPFLNNKNKEINIQIFVNDKINNDFKFRFNNNSATNKRIIKLKIKNEEIKDILSMFKNKNPISPFDLL